MVLLVFSESLQPWSSLEATKRLSMPFLMWEDSSARSFWCLFLSTFITNVHTKWGLLPCINLIKTALQRPKSSTLVTISFNLSTICWEWWRLSANNGNLWSFFTKPEKKWFGSWMLSTYSKSYIFCKMVWCFCWLRLSSKVLCCSTKWLSLRLRRPEESMV